MKAYIDKSALVAEINRLQEATIDKNQNFLSSYHEGIFDGLSMLENFLDTLEVKEVDLKKELDYDDYIAFFKEHPEYNNGDWGFDECWVFAKYFFELGLKAQKGE